MAITTVEVTIDLNPSYKDYLAVPISQLDNNLRELAITLQNSGVNYDVQASGYDVYIEGTKSDKKGFSYKVTDISGTIVGSLITVPVQTQMTAVKGLVETEIVLKSGDDRIGSANFLIMIEGAGLADDVDTSTSELAPYLDGAQRAAETAETAASNAEESAEDAEAWAVGKRNGQDVESDDETYHNNSKYYADQVADEVTGFQAEIDALDDRIDGINLSYYETVDRITHQKTEVGIELAKDGQYSDVAIWGQGSTIPEATTSKNGWMSAQDKTKLEGISFITSTEISEVLEG